MTPDAPHGNRLASFEVRGAEDDVRGVWARISTHDDDVWMQDRGFATLLEESPGGAEGWLVFYTEMLRPAGNVCLRLRADCIDVYTICSTSSWDFTIAKRALVRDRFVEDVVQPIVRAMGDRTRLTFMDVARTPGVRPL